MVVSLEPASHVSDGCVSGTGGTGKSSGSDNFSSSFLDSWDEGVGVPVISDQIKGGLSLNGGPSQIWRHGWRVVSPDDDFGDVGD